MTKGVTQSKTFDVVRYISRPLQIAGLGLLVINAIVAIGGAMQGNTALLWGAIIASVLLVLVVLLLGALFPEALEGTRRLSANYSKPFGDNLWLALDGYLNNLSPGEQEEAWEVLVSVIRTEEGNQADGAYRKFCNGVSDHLKNKRSLYVTIKQGRVRRARRPPSDKAKEGPSTP